MVKGPLGAEAAMTEKEGTVAGTVVNKARHQNVYYNSFNPNEEVEQRTFDVRYQGEGRYQRHENPSFAKHKKKYPPDINFQNELEKCQNNFQNARRSIEQKMNNYQRDVANDFEAKQREFESQRYKQLYSENVLGSAGIPTINSIDVVMRRKQAKFKNETKSKHFHKPTTEETIRHRIHKSFGTGKLNLCQLKLFALPDQVFNTLTLQIIHCVTELNLSENRIRLLPPRFGKVMNGLKMLNVRSNNLIELPHDISRIKCLTHLVCDNNELQAIPESLPTSLSFVSMKYNRIKELPHLHHLHHLTELDFQHNQLLFLPNAMYHLAFSLKKMNFSHNSLMDLCILPAFEREAPTLINAQVEEVGRREKDWKTETDPFSGDVLYFNTVTKEVTRRNPFKTSSETRRKGVVPRLNLEELTAISKLAKPMHAEEERKIKVERQKEFPCGWEVRRVGTRVKYRNHLSKETYETIPDELNRFAVFEVLETILINNNALVSLPDSIGSLKRLKLLEVEYNKITELPETFGNLTNLTTLRLGSNSLRHLPESFQRLQSLKELNLRINRFETLPWWISSLESLEAMDLTYNELIKLPTSLYKMKSLKEMKLHNNSKLSVPSPGALLKGMDAIFWELRNLEKCEERGQPPSPKRMQVGIKGEKLTTDKHIQRDFMQKIEAAKETQVLNFHWCDLTLGDLPDQLFQLSSLVELRLTGHKLSAFPVKFTNFTHLKILNLRRNGILRLEPECFVVLNTLEDLDLRNNEIESLPESMHFLVKLKYLRLSNNQLRSLPHGLGEMQSLVEMHLDHNKIMEIPSTWKNLTSLTKLQLSYNKLTSLQNVDFTSMVQLQSLLLNLNDLSDLPPTLAHLPSLHELSLSGNQIYVLPAVIPNIPSLTTLRMRLNHLQDLPMEVSRLKNLRIFETDGNPLLAPPPAIIEEGIASIALYLRARYVRVQEIMALMNATDFAIHEDAFQPRMTPLIQSGAPFATTADLKALDDDVDRYVNGEFYKHARRGYEIIHAFVALHDQKAQLARRCVLDAFLALLRFIRKRKWLDATEFRWGIQRPWGEEGALVECYAIQPRVLFDDEEDLPCILSVIETRVKHGFVDEKFLFTREQIEDALTQYMGPYGLVGLVDDHVPFTCSCDKLIRTGKMHAPCYHPGWIVQEIIYTDEEAARKAKEDALLKDCVEVIRQDITKFLISEEGMKKIKTQVKTMKKKLRVKKKQLKKTIPTIKKEIKKAESTLKDTKALLTVQKAEKGKDWTANDEQLMTFTLEDCKETIQDRKEALQQATDELTKANQQLVQKADAFLPMVREELVEFAGIEARNKIINDLRHQALQLRLRRPWDGPQGKDFEQYRRDISSDEIEEIPDTNSVLSDVSSSTGDEEGIDQDSMGGLDSDSDSDDDGDLDDDEAALKEMRKAERGKEDSDDSDEEESSEEEEEEEEEEEVEEGEGEDDLVDDSNSDEDSI